MVERWWWVAVADLGGGGDWWKTSKSESGEAMRKKGDNVFAAKWAEKLTTVLLGG